MYFLDYVSWFVFDHRSAASSIPGLAIVILFLLLYVATLFSLIKKDRDSVYRNLAMLIFIAAGLELYRIWFLISSMFRGCSAGGSLQYVLSWHIARSLVLVIWVFGLLAPIAFIAVIRFRCEKTFRMPDCLLGATVALLTPILMHLTFATNLYKSWGEAIEYDNRFLDSQLRYTSAAAIQMQGKLRQFYEQIARLNERPTQAVDASPDGDSESDRIYRIAAAGLATQAGAVIIVSHLWVGMREDDVHKILASNGLVADGYGHGSNGHTMYYPLHDGSKLSLTFKQSTSGRTHRRYDRVLVGAGIMSNSIGQTTLTLGSRPAYRADPME